MLIYRLVTQTLLAGLIVLAAACDFNAVSDAIDDFDVVVELEPIDAPVYAQVVDASTLEPVPQARLTFSGTDAGTLIDVFSDPVSTINAKTGQASLGINNGVEPSSSNPVEFTVLVEADGYQSAVKHVRIVDADGGQFAVRLVPNDVTRPVPGTVGVRRVVTPATDSDGRLTEPLVIATDDGEPLMSIPEGVVFVDEDGHAVSGPVQAEIRAYYDGEGLLSAPEAALKDENGTLLSVYGAFAPTFTSAASGKRLGIAAIEDDAVSGKSADASYLQFLLQPHNPLEMEQTWSRQDVAVILSRLLSTDSQSPSPSNYSHTFMTGPDSWSNAYLEAARNAGLLATFELQPFGIQQFSDPFPQQRGYLSNLNIQSFLATLSSSFSGTCSLGAASVRITNPNNEPVSFDVTLEGAGFTQRREGEQLAANATMLLTFEDIAGAALASNTVFESGGKVTVNVDGMTRSVDVLGSPCVSGVTEIQLPVAPNRFYQVEAAMACPTGEKFSPRITQQSVDGLRASYVRLENDRPVGLADRAGFVSEVHRGSIVLKAAVPMAANSTYRFTAVFGNESGSKSITPAGDSVISLDFNPEEYGFSCVAE